MRLLSVLLGVGLVLGLTVFVVSKMDDEGKKVNDDVAVRLLPGGIVVPNSDGPGTASGGATDAAKTVACATAAQTLRAAEEQYQVLNGTYADLPTLVAAQLLREPSQTLYRIESTDGFATFTLVGQSGCP